MYRKMSFLSEDKSSMRICYLRNVLWSLDSLTLSLNEREYLDSRWQIIENYLCSSSVSELALKMEIAKCSMTFHVLDYVAIIIGYSIKIDNEYAFDNDVIIEMIDAKSWFDDALKNSKCLKILLKVLSLTESNVLLIDSFSIKKIISHILTKFPDLKKHNFMYKKCNRKILSRFSDEDILANY